MACMDAELTMPETVVKGHLPDPKKKDLPAWVGNDVICRNCNWQGRLIASDKLIGVGRDRHIVCPTKGCGEKIKVPVTRGE
jgi:hypothetical protein